jgi:hypothetical protein
MLDAAPSWAWTSLGIASWFLVALLFLLPWGIALDEPYWGAPGLFHAFVQGAQIAFIPAMAIAVLAGGLPIVALWILVTISRHAREPEPSSGRLRAWAMAPWLVLPLIAPPLLWITLCFARPHTLNHIDSPPVPAWLDFLVVSPGLASLLWMLLAVLAAITQFSVASRNWTAIMHQYGVCPKCSYDITSLPSTAVCPECGALLVRTNEPSTTR